MEPDTWLAWWSAITHGMAFPGSYTPSTNPLTVMTGEAS